MTRRIGERKPRKHSFRAPNLGYYLIVTDTKETEKNYMYGLRDSLPKESQDKLVIKVIKTKTQNLVEETLTHSSQIAQYCQPWIIFDKDEVGDFHKIIQDAEAHHIRVGWSNPCIEVWFNAYFGSMPVSTDSVSCHNKFKSAYFRTSGQAYNKNDPEIYSKLCRFGNEEKAFELAKQKMKSHNLNCVTSPAEMCPATTVHILVEEIKRKV